MSFTSERHMHPSANLDDNEALTKFWCTHGALHQMMNGKIYIKIYRKEYVQNDTWKDTHGMTNQESIYTK